MTDAQRVAIREVCQSCISTGIAFAYQKERREPEYSADRALAEIERILEGRDEPLSDD